VFLFKLGTPTATPPTRRQAGRSVRRPRPERDHLVQLARREETGERQVDLCTSPRPHGREERLHRDRL